MNKSYLHFFVFLILSLTTPAWAVPTFTPVDGVLASSIVVQAVAPLPLADCAVGAVYCRRFYYIQQTSSGTLQILSAVNGGGVISSVDPGVRLSTATSPPLDVVVSSITGFTMLPLNSGGFRMLYSVLDSTGSFRIYSATSADGLAWANDPTLPIISVANGVFVGYPSMVQLTSSNETGDWRLYYVQNSGSGNQVFQSLSLNQGTSWQNPALVLNVPAGQVSATVLTNGDVRLYYTAPLQGQTTDTVVLSALSTDGTGAIFDLENTTLVSTAVASGSLSYPFAVRGATETFRWRLYYDYTPVGLSTGLLYNEITEFPTPGSLSPSAVSYLSTASTFTISGEIFSTFATPTVQLTMSGQSAITGTDVMVVNDQTLTAIFNTQGQATGVWNLVVTNPDGEAGTLANALSLTVPAGSVALTDNLIRPLQGGKTTINVTIFAPGEVTLKLYTMTGELVNDLFDQTMPVGTFTEFWSGLTGQGHTVASGVYVLKATGPNLNSISKIVVIK